MKIESILKALSISNHQDIERLQRFFFTDDEQGEPELISPDTVSNFLPVPENSPHCIFHTNFLSQPVKAKRAQKTF
jgi:hypothetical protein